MKRVDLLKKLAAIAKERGETFTMIEGGNHTKVRIGQRAFIVPRHRELQEFTARGILKEARKEKQ